MPEGHTIHRLARRLNGDLTGAVVSASSPQGRFADGAAHLDGSEYRRAWAHGKHLFIELDTDGGPATVHVHLGLFGRFRRRPAPPPEPAGALRLRLVGPERAWDLSGPTACELVEPGVVADLLARLGPDPLRPDADPERFVSRARRSSRPIGALLVDQAAVAGIGNVYRAELLFRAGLDPRRSAEDVPVAALEALWEDAVCLLRVGERLGRIVTVEPGDVRVPDRLVTPAKLAAGERLYVYRRERCLRCAGEVERFELGNRWVYTCPLEQR